MNITNETVKMIVDVYNNRLEKYSLEDANKTIREALIEANNGSTTINIRDIRDGKCNGLFTIIEKAIQTTVNDGMSENEFLTDFVEWINVGDGDQAQLVADNNTVFVVDETAEGTQGVRRQRLAEKTELRIPTKYHTVRIYEELGRILAGKADFSALIEKVARSFVQARLEEIYKVWQTATANDLGGAVFFPAAGSYSEDTLLTLIDHVEAAAGGGKATIIGTKKAIRNLKESVQSDGAKEELHSFGYYGTFFGTPVVALPQRHKAGTTDFVYDDNTITIVATTDKPIKFVVEGSPLVIMRDPTQNFDTTQEYFVGEKWGVALFLVNNGGIGRYEMTS